MDEKAYIENPQTADSGDETWCIHAPQFCAGGYSSWTGPQVEPYEIYIGCLLNVDLLPRASNLLSHRL